MKRVIYIVALLFFIVSMAHAVRLPSKGKFKNITEFIGEVQEEDIWHSRDPKANRRASEDKYPWRGDANLWDMETTEMPLITIPEWCLLECPPLIMQDECEDYYT